MSENSIRKGGYVIFAIIVALAILSLAITLPWLGSGKPTQVSNISLSLVGIITVAVFGSVIVMEHRTDRRRVNYLCLMLSESVMLFLDILFWRTLHEISVEASTFLWTVQYCSQVLVCYYFTLFAIEFFSIARKDSHRLEILMAGAMAICILFSVTNYWTGFIFDIGVDEIVTMGWGSLILNMFFLIIIGGSLVYLFKYGKSKSTLWFMSLFPLVPILGIVVQLVIPEISIATPLLAYSVVFLSTAALVGRGAGIDKNREAHELEDSQALTQQIAPHFMFNALSSIMNLPENTEESRELISDFSIYLRNTLDSITLTKPIPFDSEIERVETYVDIKKKIYGGRLRVIYDIKDRDFMVPSLIIRTVVSNYVTDNIDREGMPVSIIIATWCKEGHHFVSIRNINATDNTRAIFRRLNVEPESSAIFERMDMLVGGVVRHEIGEDDSVALILDIPEVAS